MSNKDVGLPVREFLYTLDQIAFLLEVTEDYLKKNMIFYEGRSVGVAPRDRMVARNIAPEGLSPEWRVPERHLRRWMRFKGWKIYERGYLK